MKVLVLDIVCTIHILCIRFTCYICLMFKDLIHYLLAPWVSHEQLLAIAQKVYDDRMVSLPWLVSWEIHKKKDGSYTDIVIWKSEEDADMANKSMDKNIHAQERYACYDMQSIVTEKLYSVDLFVS